MAFEGPAESFVDEESDTGATHAGKAVSDEKSENVSGELVMGGSQVVNAVNEGKDNERPGSPLAESDGKGNIMEIIGERMKTSICGCVLPEDYSEGSQMDLAQHYNDLELETDFVALKSFLEEAKADYFKHNPMDDAMTSMKVKKARFMYDQYYYLCSKFYIKQSFEQRKLSHRMEIGRAHV